jgi:hypothetical protein
VMDTDEDAHADLSIPSQQEIEKLLLEKRKQVSLPLLHFCVSVSFSSCRRSTVANGTHPFVYFVSRCCSSSTPARACVRKRSELRPSSGRTSKSKWRRS